MTPNRRQLHLNAFLMANGHHEAAWRLPGSDPEADFDIEHWKVQARIAEAAKFDSIFLADGPALWSSGEFRPPGALEPLTVLTALSGATERIGLIATLSTTYNSPYNLARRFASLDHISAGRAGWNIVTTADLTSAQNFGLDVQPEPADRYRRADEFLQVARKLWDSWEEDASIGDKATGRYADPGRIHPIEHEGRYYRVRGALNVRRSPQGYALLVQAGSSPDGVEFAAKHAEAIFTAHQTRQSAATFYAAVKDRVHAIGRDRNQVKVLPGIVPVLGSTEAEARSLERELDQARIPEYGINNLAQVLEIPADLLRLDSPLPDEVFGRRSVRGSQSRSDLIVDLARREGLKVRQIISRLGGGRGHFTLVGTPEQVAQTIEEWFTTAAADGFNVMPPLAPSGLTHFAEQVAPILRRRGLFRSEYTGRTLREHYGLPHPANQFAATDLVDPVVQRA